MMGLVKMTSCGLEMDLSPRRFGLLRSSSDALGRSGVLAQRMEEDGYVYLPGALPLDEVKEARWDVLRALRDEGALDPEKDWTEGWAKPGLSMAFRPDLANGRPPVQRLVYSDRMMSLMEEILGGKARHYDYTWLRAMAPGMSTPPHYDIVYMGRGTHRVLTAWTPLSQVPMGHGGLIILEGSHRLEQLKATYGALDVDEVCANKEGKMRMNDLGYHGYGALAASPQAVADQFDLRWLTADFSMGDLLIFSMFTLHGSADNHSPFIRLSTDSRCQLASEPVDERWVGESPMGHGGKATKEMIC
jgi:hypothetical protein